MHLKIDNLKKKKLKCYKFLSEFDLTIEEKIRQESTFNSRDLKKKESL